MPANTWSVSAMAGTDRGETNEPTSMRRTPVSESASTSRTRASTGTGGSFCSPSRGPTSRMLTDAGNCKGTSARRDSDPDRTGAAAPGASDAIQQISLLAVELLVGDEAAVAQGGEALQVVEGAVLGARRGRRHRPRGGVRVRRGAGDERLRLPLLHAVVDLELHRLGV